MGLLQPGPSAHPGDLADGQRGIPKTYRNMNGYGSTPTCGSTAPVEKFWVKYHFKTDQGIDFLTQAEADELAGSDADERRRDLYESMSPGTRRAGA